MFGLILTVYTSEQNNKYSLYIRKKLVEEKITLKSHEGLCKKYFCITIPVF